MSATDGIGVMTKEWSESYVAYRFRVLSKALGQLNITTNGNVVEVRGTKKNADLTVYVGNVAQSPTIGFEDGLLTTGATVEGDEDPAVASMQIPIPIPTVTSDDESVTITNNGGANGPIYDLSVDASDALPSGTSGQILRHNGTTWVATSVTEVTLSYCASGTPTTGTFLKL